MNSWPRLPNWGLLYETELDLLIERPQSGIIQAKAAGKQSDSPSVTALC